MGEPLEHTEVDVLVIGAGAAGRSAAAAAAAALADERRPIAGPQVILVDDSAGRGADTVRLGAALRRLASVGVPWEQARYRVGPLRPDAVREPRSLDERVWGGRIAVLAGQANFLAADRVIVEAYAVGVPGAGLTTTHLVRPRRVVLATGRRPAIPAVPGLTATAHLFAGRLTELTALPDSVAILGAGRDGCNTALTLAAFGSTVSLVERRDRVLADEDQLAAHAVGRALLDAKIRLLLGREVVSLAPTLDDGAWVGTDDGTDVAAERLILATGYRPATAGLDLDVAGIRLTDTGAVRVDDRLRTTGDGVFAAGAVTGTPPGAAAAMGAMAGRAAAARRPRERWRESQVPRILLIGPDVVTVGDTRATGAVRWHVSPAGDGVDGVESTGSVGSEPEPAVLRLLVQATDPGAFVGGTAVGPAAAELIAAVAVGIRAGLPAQAVADVLATPGGQGGILAAVLARPPQKADGPQRTGQA